MSTLIITLLIILVVIFFALIIRSMYAQPVYIDDDVEEVTTTTTTTTTTVEPQGIATVGKLQRQWDGQQPYVIDPIDGVKWFLNTTDDIYEDAKGQWWTII